MLAISCLLGFLSNVVLDTLTIKMPIESQLVVPHLALIYLSLTQYVSTAALQRSHPRLGRRPIYLVPCHYDFNIREDVQGYPIFDNLATI